MMFKKASNKGRFLITALLGMTIFLPGIALASETSEHLDLTGHWVGYISIILFILAYSIVIGEEFLHLRKSKPVIVAAGLIWALIGFAYAQIGDHHTAAAAVRHNLLEFGELFLFLLAAMTYINTMEERQVFALIRSWLVSQRFSLRTIFWITGVLAFFISPLADNLTTALLMSTVVMTVGGRNHRFVSLACINIVVAANAGGAFSPFGDITTLMVWQKGFDEFDGLDVKMSNYDLRIKEDQASVFCDLRLVISVRGEKAYLLGTNDEALSIEFRLIKETLRWKIRAIDGIKIPFLDEM